MTEVVKSYGPLRKVRAHKSEAYLNFVREHKCACCGTSYPCQAHHECFGHNTMGGKCSDYLSIPLCWSCHSIRHSVSSKEFWGSCNRDPAQIVIDLLIEYITNEQASD